MAKAGAHYKGRGTLQRQRHTTGAGAGWHQAVLVPYFGALCCNVSGAETSTLLHIEYGNTVTLWESIWGDPHAQHLGGHTDLIHTGNTHNTQAQYRQAQST